MKNSLKNSVMNGNIDPNIVMERSTVKIGGWNSVQPSNQHLLEYFVDENEPWLLIGIPNRDPFFATQYLETTLCEFLYNTRRDLCHREDLHVMMQCHKRQHFAHRFWMHEHPGGHATWRTHDEEIHKRISHVLRTKTCVQMECSEDAIRIKSMRAQNNIFPHKQLENHNSFGELL